MHCHDFAVVGERRGREHVAPPLVVPTEMGEIGKSETSGRVTRLRSAPLGTVYKNR
jgi:hypothetical protein